MRFFKEKKQILMVVESDYGPSHQLNYSLHLFITHLPPFIINYNL